MDRLHQSQIKAYREAAIHSIKEWSASLPLQPMEEGDSKTAFVGRCIAAAGTSAAGMNGHALPNWELATAKATAINEIRKRANATYEKYHPVEEDVVAAEETKTEQAADKNEAGTATADATADETDGDGGADTEDGEMTGDDEISDEDGEVDTSTPGATTTTKVAKPTQAKYTHPNRKKQNVGGNIINNNKNGGTQVRKKGTNAKAGYRTNNNNNNRGGPANRGGRRGGRGGGNRVQK